MNYAQVDEFKKTGAALQINGLARKFIQTIGGCHCHFEDALNLINSVYLLMVI